MSFPDCLLGLPRFLFPLTLPSKMIRPIPSSLLRSPRYRDGSIMPPVPYGRHYFFRKWNKLSEFSGFLYLFHMLYPCVYLCITADSIGKQIFFCPLAALFALSRIGGKNGSSLGMIYDHESCLSNMTIYAMRVFCGKLHEQKNEYLPYIFLTIILQPALQATLQFIYQHLTTTPRCYH